MYNTRQHAPSNCRQSNQKTAMYISNRIILCLLCMLPQTIHATEVRNDNTRIPTKEECEAVIQFWTKQTQIYCPKELIKMCTKFLIEAGWLMHMFEKRTTPFCWVPLPLEDFRISTNLLKRIKKLPTQIINWRQECFKSGKTRIGKDSLHGSSIFLYPLIYAVIITHIQTGTNCICLLVSKPNQINDKGNKDSTVHCSIKVKIQIAQKSITTMSKETEDKVINALKPEEFLLFYKQGITYFRLKDLKSCPSGYEGYGESAFCYLSFRKVKFLISHEGEWHKECTLCLNRQRFV